VGNPRRQQRPFPLDSRSFKAFQLRQHLQQTFFAGQLRLRREMLPAEQPAQEDGGCDRLHLPAQRAHGEAVNPLKNPPLTPLNVVIVRCGRPFKASAQQQALHLHRQKRLEDFARSDAQRHRQLVRRGGAQYL
jgi:hypothetical protein